MLPGRSSLEIEEQVLVLRPHLLERLSGYTDLRAFQSLQLRAWVRLRFPARCYWGLSPLPTRISLRSLDTKQVSVEPPLALVSVSGIWKALQAAIAAETARRGLEFQLGIWTHAYQWTDSPKSDHHIVGLHAGDTRRLLPRCAWCRNTSKPAHKSVGLLCVFMASGIPEGRLSVLADALRRQSPEPGASSRSRCMRRA